MLENKNPTLGILGGLGPQSTVLFYDMLTRHTQAKQDNEHINMIISSHATTPDRTAFILGQSDDNPMDVMLEDAKKLVSFGASLLVVPCNTAHYFYNALHSRINVHMVNIITETVQYLKSIGKTHPAILGTDGTVQAGGYQEACEEAQMLCEIPTPDEQEVLMHIIYDQVKGGQKPDAEALWKVGQQLVARGCDSLIIGCTELSLVPKCDDLPFFDSLEVLACCTIADCHKTPILFDPTLIQYALSEARHETQ